jgi:hypothetical protein
VCRCVCLCVCVCVCVCTYVCVCVSVYLTIINLFICQSICITLLTLQGGGAGSCNIHLKGAVQDAMTGTVSQLGAWLLRHKRQKAKGWLKREREAKVRYRHSSVMRYVLCVMCYTSLYPSFFPHLFYLGVTQIHRPLFFISPLFSSSLFPPLLPPLSLLCPPSSLSS